MSDATPPAAHPRDLSATMAFDPMVGLADLEAHLTTLKDEATLLGYPFDRHGVRNELQAATFRLREAAAVELVLSPSGAIAIVATTNR
ncbi:hypothetical protein ACFSC3_09575 [Sphingomonas floccifaciens]|uniref:Uncharacterized protein n=1 Tax=Sphingomonas floccifaciens TaxID=1844115 RepID=A0ABW4NE75_9SPHN